VVSQVDRPAEVAPDDGVPHLENDPADLDLIRADAAAAVGDVARDRAVVDREASVVREEDPAADGAEFARMAESSIKGNAPSLPAGTAETT